MQLHTLQFAFGYVKISFKKTHFKKKIGKTPKTNFFRSIVDPDALIDWSALSVTLIPALQDPCVRTEDFKTMSMPRFIHIQQAEK